jgi:putative ABC transport system ATP-binding protein
MISLNNVTVTFGHNTIRERNALNNISLSLNEGEFVTVIGSNGAGKSTLLNTISGEILPTHGTLFIDDENVTQHATCKRSHRVARVFQDPLAGTCGDLTLSENMALAYARGKNRFFKKALTRSRLSLFRTSIATLGLGLENRLDTPMEAFSGGQRQSICLLMATLSPLTILLLDEHTAALDPKTAESVMALTEKIVRDKQLTTLMVTHSLTQALHYGTRTIMLHEGRIIFDVAGEERARLTIHDLLKQFGQSMDDDRLLL